MCGCWVQRALRTLVNTTVHMCRPTHECPRTLRHVERFAQREVDGEPGKHVGRVGGRVDGQVDVVVQLGVEVASKAMAHCTGAPGGGGGGARGGRWAPVAVAAATMVEAAAASTAAAGGGGSSTGSTARTPVPPGGVHSKLSLTERVLSMTWARLGCSKVNTSCEAGLRCGDMHTVSRSQQARQTSEDPQAGE